MSILSKELGIYKDPIVNVAGKIDSLQKQLDEYDKLLGRVRFEIREMDGVPRNTMADYLYYLGNAQVVTNWLDEIARKKKEDAEKAKIVQIVNEELDKRKPAKKRNNDLRA